MALVLLSGSFALAQSAPPAAPANPTTMPAPSTNATVGQSPNVNPSNSQDLSNRSNPQDLTKSGASNPQDLTRRAK
jgi:hypothetical protein